MVDEQQNDQVTLMDFGLVRAATGSGLTKTGVIVGTPEYMSPEQAEGKEVDSRTDIYSLGVVVFKMLTGRVPFSRSTPHAVLIAHMTQEPPSISSISPELPAPVEGVVRKALAKDREKRYGRVSDLGREFAMAIADEMPAAGKGPSRSRAAAEADIEPTVVTQKPTVKVPGKRWLWAVGAAGALLLVGLCAVAAFALELFPFSALASPTSTPTVVPTSTLAATRGVEATATLVRTPSRTSKPSPSPSARPSATAKSAATSTSTSAPISTDTPAPTVTSAPAATPTARPTEPQPATAPQRMAPSQGGTFKNPIMFQWTGSLGAGQSYQVTASHRASNHIIQSEPLATENWSTSLPDDKAGEWLWSVAVVQDGSAVITSSQGMFWFDPFGGRGGGGGGGGDVTNTPPTEP
jgi:serine/threonine-protein kinase